jgi:predicted RNA-binding protein YlqC (UPF0109 family)
MKDLSELVRYLATQLVENPDTVEVNVRGEEPVVYELHVDPEDQGRIIGREGRTIQALRILVGAAARKTGDRATLELAE